MEATQTDAAAFARSLTDPAAFDVIFERHYRAVHGYLSRRLGSAAADDVASETFLIAFRRRRGYDGRYPDSRPWLFGIAINLARSHLRSERRRLTVHAATDPAGLDLRLSAVDRQLSPDERQRLLGAIAALNRGERDALTLYALADLTYDEIARALNISAGTVASRLSRARQTLRAELGVDSTSFSLTLAKEAADA